MWSFRRRVPASYFLRGEYNMKTVKIDINGIYDITEFVRQATKVDSGVTVYKGSVAIDGASLVGMMSLDTTGGIDVEYPETALDFDDFISNFIIK